MGNALIPRSTTQKQIDIGSKNWRLSVQSFLASPCEYSFQQALRMLEETGLGGDVLSDSARLPLMLSPAREINFPAADIKRAMLSKEGILELELNFMGFFGVDSPLPLYFSFLALQDNLAAQRIRAFLKIINQPIYFLYYLAWKKYQPHIQLESRSNRYLDYLRALSGGVLTKQDSEEYSYAGLLGSPVHNSTSLAAMLQDFLGGINVKVKEFQSQWLEFFPTHYLGGAQSTALQLGKNVLLGNKVCDVSHNLAIHIGPITFQTALQFLPHDEKAKRLISLIKRYLKPTLNVAIVLLIRRNLHHQSILGNADLCLGWSTWLGQQTQKIYNITSLCPL